MRAILLALWTVLALALAACASGRPGPPLPAGTALTSYRILEVEPAADESGANLPSAVIEAVTARLRAKLADKGLTTDADPGDPGDVALVRSRLVGFQIMNPSRPETAPGARNEVVLQAAVVDKATGRLLVDFATVATGRRSATTARSASAEARLIDEATGTLAEEIARQLAEASSPGPEARPDAAEGAAHLGHGLFVTRAEAREGEGASGDGEVVNLKQIVHGHDPAVDTDVPPFTNVTLNDRVPSFVDDKGRRYALITLYNIDPPLEDLPSAEPGVDRGTDFRDPANLVKGAYSNYVSPVLTADGTRRPVAGHPIGHFLVKAQVPGYPTVLTGMTTIQRADEELADWTLGRQLGLGGVLLTPQPGRLNSAAEALEELTRRQGELVVVDGRHYRNVDGRNLGPTYVIEDGNVSFARFRLPVANAEDALRVFVAYVERGVHNTFGSLVNRPHKGNGAGCAAFAFSWLKAAGAVPFVDEAALAGVPGGSLADGDLGSAAFWAGLYRRVNVPWDHIGCDDRLGLAAPQSARYTVFDLLFHDERRKDLVEASQGLVARLRADIGVLGATLFQFGALTPLRDIFIESLRKDPDDRGDYAWTTAESGLAVGFWDNGLFSDWVKGYWRGEPRPAGIELVREGRFQGIEIDAMATPRQAERFFESADRILERRRALAAEGVVPESCRAAFALGIQ